MRLAGLADAARPRPAPSAVAQLSGRARAVRGLAQRAHTVVRWEEYSVGVLRLPARHPSNSSPTSARSSAPSPSDSLDSQRFSSYC
jgi:hypothetical protein